MPNILISCLISLRRNKTHRPINMHRVSDTRKKELRHHFTRAMLIWRHRQRPRNNHCLGVGWYVNCQIGCCHQSNWFISRTSIDYLIIELYKLNCCHTFTMPCVTTAMIVQQLSTQTIAHFLVGAGYRFAPRWQRLICKCKAQSIINFFEPLRNLLELSAYTNTYLPVTWRRSPRMPSPRPSA